MNADEPEDVLGESVDTLAPLPTKTDNVIEQLSVEKMNNPSKFASFWEMDEDDIEEPTWEEIQNDPKLKLLWAAEKGNMEVAQELLASDLSLLHAADPDGYTPLHRASYEGHVDVIKYLLSLGADINKRTNDGWSPLHSAAIWGQVKVVEELLSLGADINAQTNSSQTALHLAASSTHTHSEQMLQLLLMHPDVNYALVNDLGESAQTVANRCSKYAHLFEMCEDSVNHLT